MDGVMLAKDVHIGEFTVDPEHHAEFVRHILDNARASLAAEKGCLQFDVLVPPDGSPRVILYEVFESRADFEAHQHTPHFRVWKERAGHWVRDLKVTELERAV